MLEKGPLSRFENFARTLIEGSFDRLLGQQSVLIDVASALAAAAEETRRGDVMANRYIVRLSRSSQAELAQQTPDAALLLEDLLSRLQREEQLVLEGELSVQIVVDDSEKPGRVAITAEHLVAEDEATAVLKRRGGVTAPLELLDAYLIVGGRRHVALEQAVTSIGRSLENDIVLDDPDVSRRHAQVRWRHGRFILFDLGSRAGSLVNEMPIKECELKAGDVIRFGGVALVYGEEGESTSPNAAERVEMSDITQELTRDDLS